MQAHAPAQQARDAQADVTAADDQQAARGATVRLVAGGRREPSAWRRRKSASVLIRRWRGSSNTG